MVSNWDFLRLRLVLIALVLVIVLLPAYSSLRSVLCRSRLRRFSAVAFDLVASLLLALCCSSLLCCRLCGVIRTVRYNGRNPFLDLLLRVFVSRRIGLISKDK